MQLSLTLRNITKISHHHQLVSFERNRQKVVGKANCIYTKASNTNLPVVAVVAGCYAGPPCYWVSCPSQHQPPYCDLTFSSNLWALRVNVHFLEDVCHKINERRFYIWWILCGCLNPQQIIWIRYFLLKILSLRRGGFVGEYLGCFCLYHFLGCQVILVANKNDAGLWGFSCAGGIRVMSLNAIMNDKDIEFT